MENLEKNGGVQEPVFHERKEDRTPIMFHVYTTSGRESFPAQSVDDARKQAETIIQEKGGAEDKNLSGVFYSLDTGEMVPSSENLKDDTTDRDLWEEIGDLKFVNKDGMVVDNRDIEFLKTLS